MTSNPRHSLPPRLRAHQPTRFATAQESKPSPSPGIRMICSARVGSFCCGHVRGCHTGSTPPSIPHPGLYQEQLMPFSSLAARPREDHPARPAGAPEPRFYSTDLLPTMQDLLAAVADLETRYE